MSKSGSKIREQVAHFLVDIHSAGKKQAESGLQSRELRKTKLPRKNAVLKKTPRICSIPAFRGACQQRLRQMDGYPHI